MKLYLFIFFLLITKFAISQQNVYRQYTVDDGLLDDEVFYVHQDAKGYLWFATNSGVNRFDGYKFEEFTVNNGLAENPTLEIYEDYKGRIWFVPYDCRYSYYEDGKITKYKYNEVINEKMPRKRYNNLTFKVDSNDAVSLAGTYGTIKINDTGACETHEYLIKSFEGIEFFLWKNALFRPLKSRFIKMPKDHPLYYTKADTVWLPFGVKRSAHLKSQILVEKYKNTYYIVNQRELLITNDFKNYKSLHFDGRINFLRVIDGSLWIAVIENGVYQYSLPDLDKAPVHYFKDLTVSSVLKDFQNGYWFTTITRGVFFLPDKSKLNYVLDDYQRVPVNEIALMDSTLYLVTNNGELAYLDHGIKVIDFLNDSVKEYVRDMQYNPYDSLLYIGGMLLYTFDGEQIKGYVNNHDFYIKINGSFTVSTKSIMCDREKVWVGASASLFQFSKEKFIYASYPDDSVLLKVESINRDLYGDLWLGTTSGLFQYSQKAGYVNFKQIDERLQNRISCICNDSNDSSVWIGTHGSGLLNFNPKTQEIHKQFNTEDGLLSNSILNLHMGDSSIWIGSNHGLMELSLYDENDIYTYTIDDGLPSNKINEVIVFNDTVYAATDAGLLLFPTFNTNENENNMPVYITKFQVMDKDTTICDDIALPYNENFVSINFLGISFRNDGHIKYRYILEGLNDKWNTTYNTNIKFASLSPGDYVFKVSALNKSGEWSVPAQVRFTIITPFWNTTAFKVFITILILLIFSGILRYRTNVMKKENQLREDVAVLRQKALAKQMDPHFIYNSLNSIQSFIIKNENMVAVKYLAKFSKLMRKVLQNSTESYITIEEEMESINLYLELERVRFNKKFDFDIKIDPKIIRDLTYIPSFFVQPFVENAIWHGLMNLDRQGEVVVAMEKKINAISILIQDNGIGREKAKAIKKYQVKEHTSMGIDITRQRLDLVNRLHDTNYKIEIIDVMTEKGMAMGTKVQFNLPCLEK